MNASNLTISPQGLFLSTYRELSPEQRPPEAMKITQFSLPPIDPVGYFVTEIGQKPVQRISSREARLLLELRLGV